MASDQLILDRWTCAASPPDKIHDAAALAETDLDLHWLPLTVPGTAARAQWPEHDPTTDTRLRTEYNFDAEDWWFRTSFECPPGDQWDLVFGGLATLSDVWLNRHHLLSSANMFRSHRVDIDECLIAHNELVVRCRALDPQLAVRRRPRPRWKARLPASQNLRWFRTTLLGRSPEWTPSIAPVGPWRPVSLEARAAFGIVDRRMGVGHDGTDGTLDITFVVHMNHDLGPDLRADDLVVDLVVGDTVLRLDSTVSGDQVTVSGRITVVNAEPWWPATHGGQPRYRVRAEVACGPVNETIEMGFVGFRTITFDRADQPVLRVNDVPVFCRGACWVPIDPVGLADDADRLRATLELLREAGMNMVRVQGSLLYESETFHELCDELGILVWQDLMFTTLDYPCDDPAFRAEVESEIIETLDRLQSHPSTAVICGGSEVYQQAAMVGRPPDEIAHDLFDAIIPRLLTDRLPSVPYWPNSPTWNGSFAVDSGAAHYFGVGGYLRPLSDARTSGVRFASECLAFSCVPDDHSVRELRKAGTVPGNGAWKSGVPRDAGRSWDFEDVRDHYVNERFGLDPTAIRAVDPEFYLDLGRAAVAEVMAATLSEWRRPGSPCRGAVILGARDLVPGAGFGLIDVAARPKSAWFALRRVLQPVALIVTDEGLNGLDIHAINDTGEPMAGQLTVSAFAGTREVAEKSLVCAVPPRSAVTIRAEAVLGTFLDLTWAYRFGPRSIDAVSAHWQPAGAQPTSTVFFPGGVPIARGNIGLSATARTISDNTTELAISTQQTARCVLIDTPGHLSDNAFDLEPGRTATVTVSDHGSSPLLVRSLNSLHSIAAVPAP